MIDKMQPKNALDVDAPQIEELLREIAAFRGRRVPWFELSHRVRRLQWAWSQPFGLNPKRRNAVTAAAEATGRSANFIARQVKVDEFGERLASNGVAELQALRRAPFVSLELLNRVWQVDALSASGLLHDVLRGRLSVRKLKAHHHDIIGQIGAPRQSRGARLRERLERRVDVLMVLQGLRLAGLVEESEYRFLHWRNE